MALLHLIVFLLKNQQIAIECFNEIELMLTIAKLKV
jgi:hypothetical protein